MGKSVMKNQQSISLTNAVKHSFITAISVALFLFLSSCGSSPSEQSDTTFLAMGTTVSITVVGERTESSNQAINAARAELQRVGREWYPWAQDGELVRLNGSLAAGSQFTASTELAELLDRSKKYSQLSNGTFDPAIGGLVRLWGFSSAENTGRSLPTAKQIAAWAKSPPTMEHLHIDGNVIRSDRRDVVIDLGAIGKGYAVDRAIELLKQNNIANAMVNAGGNLRCIGQQGTRSWRVAIRDPRAVRTLAWVELNDESVSTSGDYERFAIVTGTRIHHLLDSRSGQPANHTMAVTVIAADAALADAASTALFVAGPQRWRELARAMGIDQVLRVDASGAIEVTHALHSRLVITGNENRQVKWTVVE
jgi:FAD:protein FMN transferase